jgi:hypothetical protein
LDHGYLYPKELQTAYGVAKSQESPSSRWRLFDAERRQRCFSLTPL